LSDSPSYEWKTATRSEGPGPFGGTFNTSGQLEKDPRKAIAAMVALARLSGKDAIHRKENDPAPDADLRARMLTILDNIA